MFTTLSYVYDVYDANATISNNSSSNNSSSNSSHADDGEEPFIYNIYVWLVAGIFAWSAVAVAAVNGMRHVCNFTKPNFQTYELRIIAIVPVYAMCSWFALHFYDVFLYIETVRDCYEAYIIYCFVMLILEFAGGESKCMMKIQEKGSMKHPWPFGCLPKISLDGRFLRRCKQGALQFVVVKPVMAALSIGFLLAGLFENIYYKIFRNTVYNISYTLALYCLALIYMATKDFVKQHGVIGKFAATKSVIFLPYYQNLFAALIPFISEANAWNNLLMCVEMLVFAVLHLVAFRPPRQAKTKRDTSDSKKGKEVLEMLENVGKVFGVQDVVQDALHNFDPQYEQYNLQYVSQEEPTNELGEHDEGEENQLLHSPHDDGDSSQSDDDHHHDHEIDFSPIDIKSAHSKSDKDQNLNNTVAQEPFHDTESSSASSEDETQDF